MTELKFVHFLDKSIDLLELLFFICFRYCIKNNSSVFFEKIIIIYTYLWILFRIIILYYIFLNTSLIYNQNGSKNFNIISK